MRRSALFHQCLGMASDSRALLLVATFGDCPPIPMTLLGPKNVY